MPTLQNVHKAVVHFIFDILYLNCFFFNEIRTHKRIHIDNALSHTDTLAHVHTHTHTCMCAHAKRDTHTHTYNRSIIVCIPW